MLNIHPNADAQPAFPCNMPAEKPTAPRLSDSRRSNKPVMEKRRRARINQCLNELKSLILEALRKDPSRHSKLEKADILEMTVKHLQNVQRHQMAVAMASDPSVLNKFRSGFNECAAEVTRYVNRIEGVESGVRQRLVAHLTNCVTGLSGIAPLATLGGGVMATAALATALSVPQFPLNDVNNNNTNMAAARLLSGLSLIPGRLLGGDITLLLPNQSGIPIFSPNLPTPTTPSATVTKDGSADKLSAFTAVGRTVAGALSPSSCTSGSSAFSPTLRDSSSPEVQSSFSSLKSGGGEPSTSSFSNSDSSFSTTPSSSASSAEGERMWRPW